jgi:hypothetical protein
MIEGEWIPGAILITYLVIGVAIYLGYGRHHSRVRQAGPEREATIQLVSG